MAIPKPTDTLDKDKITTLINAFAFAEHINHPLNLAFTVQWRKLSKGTGRSESTLIRRFTSRLSNWFNRHVGEPAHYIYVNENGSTIKLHSHFLIHIPQAHIRAFLDKLPSLVPGQTSHGDSFTIFIHPDTSVRDALNNQTDPASVLLQSDTRSLSRHVLRPIHSQRVGLFRYMLKGADHTCTCVVAGTEYNFAELLGIRHRGNQGIVTNALRASVSHSLGRKSRKAHGWIELSAILDLRHVLDNPQVAKDSNVSHNPHSRRGHAPDPSRLSDNKRGHRPEPDLCNAQLD